MRLRVLAVSFPGREPFLAQAAHLARGCLLVPVPSPSPEPLADLIVRLETPTGSGGEVRARVLQVVAGYGLALSLEDPAADRARFAAWFEEARRGAPGTGAAQATWVEDVPAPAPAPSGDWEDATAAAAPADEEPLPPAEADAGTGPPEAAGPLADRIKAMTVTERMQLAKHGDRPARLLLMRDTNKVIQLFLLQNPHLTQDEARALAGSRQAHPEVLQQIAGRPDWNQDPGVAAALVRNPKTPSPVAVRLLDRLPAAELRRLARSNDVVRPVQLAARKKVQEQKP